jgi:hypothetical protein
MRLLPLMGLSVVVCAADNRVTPHVTVSCEPVNGVLISRNGKMVAVYGDPPPNAARTGSRRESRIF